MLLDEYHDIIENAHREAKTRMIPRVRQNLQALIGSEHEGRVQLCYRGGATNPYPQGYYFESGRIYGIFPFGGDREISVSDIPLDSEDLFPHHVFIQLLQSVDEISSDK